jgi:prepilin-type processing-associated H-X9-DG protein
VKQLITAVHAYAGDYNGAIPYGGNGTGSYWYTPNTLGGYGSDPTCPTPHGLGMLLYHAYLNSGRAYFCPSESPAVWSGPGVYAMWTSGRYQQILQLNGVADSPAGFQTLVNASAVDFMSAYCFRGIATHESYWGGAYPAHGPPPAAGSGWSQLYAKIDQPRCAGDFCNGYHPVFALISDSFLYNLGAVSPIYPQGRFRHRTGYNVAYADGHVRFAADPNGVIKNLDASGPNEVIDLKRVAEDIWNAFDSYAGYQYFTTPGYGYVMGLPKE